MLWQILDEQVAQFEDQAARASVAHRKLVSGAQPVEKRQSHFDDRDA
mgnify:CR=1 FL=1